MKIYTKTGDYGETSLFNGTRVKKNNLRIITYGTVDEVNSNIGLLLYYLHQDEKLRDLTGTVVKDSKSTVYFG